MGQRAYVKRVIGSIPCECLDHIIVFHEQFLRRTLTAYSSYTELQSNDDKLYFGWSEMLLIQPRPAKTATFGRSFSSVAKPF